MASVNFPDPPMDEEAICKGCNEVQNAYAALSTQLRANALCTNRFLTRERPSNLVSLLHPIMTICIRCHYTERLAAGNRWHIDCFRCNTCGTLLDSDANLLLLGDGSLICNNCTYSCSACGNKIEDLAILTGDQAFCASCFRCRNCKKKIENLKYARTSQGIFCMDCHESLMQRRRKKTAKHGSSRHRHNQQPPQTQQPNNTMLIHKSLPSLPPNVESLEPASQSPFSPDNESPPSETYSDTPTELPRISQKRPSTSRSSSQNGMSSEQQRAPLKRPSNSRSNSSQSGHGHRDISPAAPQESRKGKCQPCPW